MFDQQSVDQLRVVIREEVRSAVKEEVHVAMQGFAKKGEVRSIVKEEIQDAVKHLATKAEMQTAISDLATKDELQASIGNLRADMQSQFVAQRRGIVNDVCEFIHEHVLPAIPAR